MRLVQNEFVHQRQTVDKQPTIFYILAKEPVNHVGCSQNNRFVEGSDKPAPGHTSLELTYLQAGKLSQSVHHLALIFQQGNRRIHKQHLPYPAGTKFAEQRHCNRQSLPRRCASYQPDLLIVQNRLKDVGLMYKGSGCLVP